MRQFNIEEEGMKVSYMKLWHLLLDKGMNKTDLRRATGISTCTIAKMNRGEDVTTSTLTRICEVLQCNVGDVVDFIPTENEVKEI